MNSPLHKELGSLRESYSLNLYRVIVLIEIQFQSDKQLMLLNNKV